MIYWVFPKRRGRPETQHITKVIPHTLVHIRREKHTGFLTTDFLPGKISNGIQNLLDGNTIFSVSFGEEH